MGQAAAKVAARRVELATELVDIFIKHRKDFGRIDEIKEELKVSATDAGESFREVIAGKGRVSVSGRKEKEFKGDLPEIDAATWGGLSEAKRKKLVDDGVVKVTPTWSKPYYGAVTVDLF